MTPRPLGPLAPEGLKARVAALVTQDSPGAHGAIVTVVNVDLVEVMLVLKGTHGWTVDVAAEYEWKGGPKVEATITKVW